MMHHWCCLTCGKQGMVGKGYRNLNNSLRFHSGKCHNGRASFLVISEYGHERTVDIAPTKKEIIV